MAPSSNIIPLRFVDGSGTTAACQQWEQRRDQSKALATGYKRLDSIWAPASGHLVYLAGRPGSYKTTLAWQIGCNLASQGKRVLWINAEPSMAQMMEMYAARMARIPRRALGPHGGQLTLEQQGNLTSAMEAFKKLPIIFHFSEIDIVDVLARARKIKYDAIFIDYVQLIGAKGARTPPERIEAVAKALAHHAQTEGVFVMALSQMNRAIERDSTDDTRAPMLSDLAGSAALEATADVVAFMFDVKRRGAMSNVTVFTAKNRQGEADVFVQMNANNAMCDVHEMEEYAAASEHERPTGKDRERYP
jgi:replicative DNA helicase